jgi:type IV pilus assembly protein PilA
MIVVVIIGILSVLAAYGVRKYIANAKTAEARNALGRMGGSAIIAYERESMSGAVLPQQTSTPITRSLCQSASQSVPAGKASIAGAKYQSAPGEWNVDPSSSGFACLHFTMDTPQYYMYNYTAAGSTNPGDSFAAIANGDLNGDGILSTFQLLGKINGSYALNVAPNITETSPEE